MLDYIRSNAQSFGVKVAFAIIILVFMFWGVGSLTDGGSSNVVAKVNGEAITAQQFEQAYQRAAEILYLEDPVGCYLNSRNEIVCLTAQVEDFNMTPVGIYDWPSIRVRAD